MATMLARRMPAPGWAPSGPKATMVPASALRPAASATLPAMAMSPRRRPAPASSPASPWTRTSPPRMPAREPAYAPPSRRPAEPRTTRRPPRISAPAQSPASPSTRISPSCIPAPTCGPALPAIVRRPPAIPAPRPATRVRSPSTRTSSVPPPATSNRARTAVRSLPCQSSSRSISLALRPAIRSGRSVSATTGAAGASRSVSVRLIASAPAGSRQRRRSSNDALSRHELLQMEVVLAEVAAVVAGRELPRARPRRRLEPDPHRLRHRLRREPVDDDLEDGLDAFRDLRVVDLRAQRRAQHVVRGRDRALVALGADLAAAARDAAGERHDRALDLSHRGGRGLRRVQGGREVVAQDDDVPAADALDDPEALLDEELALHHRDPPVAPAGQDLARLPAVAEEAQLAADVDLPLGVQAVEAGGGRAGEDRLAHALAQPLGEPVGVRREQQRGDAGAPVRRLTRLEHALDRGLALASDHRCREARERAAGVHRPLRRRGGHDDPRAPHAERLGERVDDLGVVEADHATGSAATLRAGSSSHGSRTG